MEVLLDWIDIQVQDLTGNWRTYARTQNNSQMILMRMKELQQQFPDQRIRAVDGSGRIIDMM